MYSLEDQPFLIHMYQQYTNKKEAGISTQDLEKLNQERKEYMEYISELEQNNKELVDILQDYHNKYKELEDYVKSEKGGGGADLERGGVIIQQKWATFSREILRLANEVRSSGKSASI